MTRRCDRSSSRPGTVLRMRASIASRSAFLAGSASKYSSSELACALNMRPTLTAGSAVIPGRAVRSGNARFGHGSHGGPADRVWDLVSDVTRIGEFSPETFEAEWLGGATGPAVGARFRGHVRRNGRGPVYWTVCTVTACDPGRQFGFDGRRSGRSDSEHVALPARPRARTAGPTSPSRSSCRPRSPIAPVLADRRVRARPRATPRACGSPWRRSRRSSSPADSSLAARARRSSRGRAAPATPAR